MVVVVVVVVVVVAVNAEAENYSNSCLRYLQLITKCFTINLENTLLNLKYLQAAYKHTYILNNK